MKSTVSTIAGLLACVVIPAFAQGADLTRFKSLQDGTLNDSHLRLMWTQRDNGHATDWFEARNYCDKLELAGRTDWRLPTFREVKSLYYKGRTIDCGTWPGCNIHFPFILTQYIVWASEQIGDKYANAFYFTNGGGGATGLYEKEKARALCVCELKPE